MLIRSRPRSRHSLSTCCDPSLRPVRCTEVALRLRNRSGGATLKNFDSRTYSVNDYVDWHRGGQLVLSPKFQRRSVWSETARSYLMDTILRGKPIPKVFIRQMIDPATGKSVREVVDGQQRLRTILSFIEDGFAIRRTHHKEYGGLYFSQLPEEARLGLRSYEISTDLLINVSDAEVLDIFSRLNAHAVVLNSQEKLNAKHFGPFKQLADGLAHEYYEYWTTNKILRDAQVMRMADVELTADLLIAMCVGIQSKKQIPIYYREFENDFPYDPDEYRQRFDDTMSAIGRVFPEGFGASEFRRVHVYYSLFTAFYHVLFGLPELDTPRDPTILDNHSRARASLERVEGLFDPQEDVEHSEADIKFLDDSRRATTDASVRIRRTEYLVNLIRG